MMRRLRGSSDSIAPASEPEVTSSHSARSTATAESASGAGDCGDIAELIERFCRDVRLFRLYEGTSKIHQRNIARQLLDRGPWTG
jgi:alkylation response protein AidB-like acyl-CoA dehydrogenase